jgi:hypothetical protein
VSYEKGCLGVGVMSALRFGELLKQNTLYAVSMLKWTGRTVQAAFFLCQASFGVAQGNKQWCWEWDWVGFAVKYRSSQTYKPQFHVFTLVLVQTVATSIL